MIPTDLDSSKDLIAAVLGGPAAPKVAHDPEVAGALRE